MATFPKIASPCPYKGALSDILDQDAVCGLCHRQVHDLSAMSERQRLAFLKSCSGETCVTYRLPAAAALAAMAMAVATPLAAQEAKADVETLVIEGSDQVYDVIVTGGIGRFARPIDIAPITIVASEFDLDDLAGALNQTQADAAKARWDETHRRLDSGKARRENKS